MAKRTTFEPLTAPVEAGRYLLHMAGVELFVVSGPHKTQTEFGDALVGLLASEDFDAEDTAHILSFGKSGPETSDFSSEFLEAAKRLARPGDPGWSEFEGTTAGARNIVYGRGGKR